MRRLRIAVTGTFGSLGSLLVTRLVADSRCARVVLLDLLPSARDVRKCAFHRIDLTEGDASTRLAAALERERPDVVVHLAFLQHPQRDGWYEHELESIGTMRLLAALAEVGGQGTRPRLVVGSSTLVYGAEPHHPALLDEDQPLPSGLRYPFVSAKIDAERQVERFARASGMPVAVLRMASVLGQGVRTLASRYLTLPAVPTILGFNPLVQLLTPEDAVDALLAAVYGARSGVYNVVPAAPLPLSTAIRICGRRALPIPGFAAIRFFDALFPAGLAIAPGAHAANLRFPFVADGERAAAELGFRAAHTTKDAAAAFASSLLSRAA
jgi:UDP-glucose 4-epimerase